MRDAPAEVGVEQVQLAVAREHAARGEHERRVEHAAVRRELRCAAGDDDRVGPRPRRLGDRRDGRRRAGIVGRERPAAARLRRPDAGVVLGQHDQPGAVLQRGGAQLHRARERARGITVGTHLDGRSDEREHRARPYGP